MVKPIQIHDYTGEVLLRSIGDIPSEGISKNFQCKTKFVPSGAEFFKLEYKHQFAAVPVHGWGLCAKFQMDGRRTIIDFVLPGDITSTWHSTNTNEIVTASNDVILAILYEDTALNSTCNHDLTQLLASSIRRRYARVVERMAMAGRVGALERLSQLLLELSMRSGVSIDGKAGSFKCPLKQADIGDALGLTSVHVNRILKELRIRKLADMHHGLVKLLDIEQLVHISGFDYRYLKS
ncbi:Crp/Fnr family transcriptional regulator [Ahrensia sp. 13_GOM-1096m]|uniref:Crp/Fnr family transcriptional regulator n=1 Tax=Ahrensia sp. 13_GOM-1096m TaxID=1380380 RepID=UPI000683DE76|nr:Crp/Fnr family transcriptional regulator [Ahrensia sp. 13_GOM-1096m]